MSPSKRPRRKQVDPDFEFDFTTTMTDHLMNRTMRERAAREENKSKKAMMEWLVERGEAEMDEPVEWVHYDSKGNRKTKQIIGARRTERVASVLDEDRAMEFLKKLVADGKLPNIDHCVRTVTVVDEDALVALAFEEVIGDDELKALYDDKTTYAFNLIEGEGEE